MNEDTKRNEPLDARGVTRRELMIGAASLSALGLGVELGNTVSASEAGSPESSGEAYRVTPRGPHETVPDGKTLRLGVVGGGFGLSFPWHLHPNCRVTAVAEHRADRRQRMRELFKTDNVYDELYKMLGDKNVDAIAIYTGAPDHARHAIDSMKAGKHVMTVIPTALTLEDCQSLIDTVNETGLTYLYGETSCFSPIALAAKDLYAAGSFGKILHTDCRYIHDLYSDMEYGMKAWFTRNGKPTWRWGYPQGFYVGHGNGPVVTATGERYTEVSGHGIVRLDHPMWESNDYGNPFASSNFFLKTARGSTSQIYMHWLTAEGSAEGADILGSELCVFGARAGSPPYATIQQQDAVKIDASAYIDRLPQSLRDVPGHEGAHPQIMHEFVLACLNERRPAVDVYQAAAITAPGLVGFESSLKDGEWMKIPDFGSWPS